MITGSGVSLANRTVSTNKDNDTFQRNACFQEKQYFLRKRYFSRESVRYIDGLEIRLLEVRVERGLVYENTNHGKLVGLFE